MLVLTLKAVVECGRKVGVNMVTCLAVCLEDILPLAVLMVVHLDPYLKIIENGDVPGVTCEDQSGHVISSVPSIVKTSKKCVSGRIECPFKLDGSRASKKENSHKVAESPYSFAKLRRIEDEESHQRIMAMIESSVSNVAIANTMNSSGLVFLPKDIANIKQKLLFADDAEGGSMKDLIFHLQSN
ncbi:hypothetical protein BDB01DRAFT_905492, partial [Pilobolus umbonatus]